MVIDFTKKKLLTEGWLQAFGSWNKTLLRHIYGKDVNMTAELGIHHLGKMFKEGEEDGQSLKFTIRGEEEDIRAYAKAIMAERIILTVMFNMEKIILNHKKQRKCLTKPLYVSNN